MLPPPRNIGGAGSLDNNGMPNLNEPIVVPSMPSPTSPPHTGRTLVGVLQGGTVVLGNAGAPQGHVMLPTIPPMIGRIINSSISGSEVIVTIGAGSNSGIAADWTAHVLSGSSQNPLAGGDIKVVRVDKQVTVGKTKLTPDQLLSNPRVKLSAP